MACLIRGDARAIPLADDSVDLIVTSPPYFGLRSYTDGGVHYDAQIGAEASPAEFVAALIEVTREMARVLKPSGSIWVNLGDKYSGSGGHAPEAPSNVARREGAKSPTFTGAGCQDKRQASAGTKGATWGLPRKSLAGIPWRYAIACIDDLGLILRAEVIWSKPNGMPESVTDRVRRSHETWFHFTKQPQYYSAVDEIRLPHVAHDRKRGRKGYDGANGLSAHGFTSTQNALGKLPGSVWSIATQPLKVPAELGVDHFAAFPMEWPRRIIKGWSPPGVCTACGEGRTPVTQRDSIARRPSGEKFIGRRTVVPQNVFGANRAADIVTTKTITGYACDCPDASAPTCPAVVLDPFGGTGTTALVADALGRRGVSLDMSADYCRLAAWRTADPGQIAKASGGRKPVKRRPPEMPGQGELFKVPE